MTWVAILMGSESDWPAMQGGADTLAELGIKCEVRITSAHRTPQATIEYVSGAESRGCQVFICGAGMAAHLAGAVAAHTLKPVIGVPLDAGPLAGFDALLATVQMPGGIPVATVAIGKAGAKNAAYLAAEILALGDEKLAARLRADRLANAARVAEQDARLAEQRGEPR
jgi:5-(carboxyamino)imidazole ribonucleotide mutase